MRAGLIAAFVKDGTRLIGRANLNLHKVGSSMLTLGASHYMDRSKDQAKRGNTICRVYILPGVSTTKDIVNLLPL